MIGVVLLDQLGMQRMPSGLAGLGAGAAFPWGAGSVEPAERDRSNMYALTVRSRDPDELGERDRVRRVGATGFVGPNSSVSPHGNGDTDQQRIGTHMQAAAASTSTGRAGRKGGSNPST